MKAIARKKGKGSLFVKLLLLAFILYSIYSLVQMYTGLAKSSQLLAEKRESEQELTLRNQELEKLLEEGNQGDMIERAARSKLGYAYSDEKVYTDISGN